MSCYKHLTINCVGVCVCATNRSFETLHILGKPAERGCPHSANKNVFGGTCPCNAQKPVCVCVGKGWLWGLYRIVQNKTNKKNVIEYVK